jgi:LAO/AO transport system kinase
MERIISKIIEGVSAQDPRSIARAISLVEDDGARALDVLKALFPKSGRAVVVGITGAPGVGKSTLVDKLALHYRSSGETVGIIAVDPSSPFTGGAILADRIRMQTLGTDPGVFIRSMATRGNLGGLARTTADAVVILDAAGYDRILVETVGVGQDEIDIVKTADATIVVLVPGLGDDVQTIKAGIMEIADIFVINKADREGAARIETEILALLQIAKRSDGWDPLVVKTVATENRGIDELAKAIGSFLDFRRTIIHGDERKQRIAEDRIVTLLREKLLALAMTRLTSQQELGQLAVAVARRERDPYSVVEQIVERLQVGGR